MKFFFDESGDFTIPSNNNQHKVAVVTGIAISDLVIEKLFGQFRNFVDSLKNSEKLNGEPKGQLFSSDSIKNFCHILSQFDGISITPVTLDLSSLATSEYTNTNEVMFNLLTERAKTLKFENARNQLRLLAKQRVDEPEQNYLTLRTLSLLISDNYKYQ